MCAEFFWDISEIANARLLNENAGRGKIAWLEKNKNKTHPHFFRIYEQMTKCGVSSLCQRNIYENRS